MERREFIKKTGAGVIAAGFPGIISAQTVTNALKVGLVGRRRPRQRRRGSGALRRSQRGAVGGGRHRRGDRRARLAAAEGQREIRRAREDRQGLLRARRLRQGHQQRRRRGPARDAAGVPAAAPDRGGERQQARLLREAVRHRFARRARGDGGAEAGADEEPGARRGLLLALQQHDPGSHAAGAQRRARPAGGALLDLLHESRSSRCRPRASGRPA